MSEPSRIMQESLKVLDESIQAGNTATESGQYAEAAHSFESAVSKCQSILLHLHCSRARALISCEQYFAAHSSSEEALRLDSKFSMAWYLNGTALSHLKRLPEAKESFLKAAEFEKDLALKVAYKDHAGHCDEKKAMQKVTDVEQDKSPEPNISTASSVRDSTRMQWYQSSKYVNMDIYAKNVIKEGSEVLFTEKSVHVRLKRPDLEDYDLQIDLADEIIASASTWTVSRVKVEIRLCKLRTSTWKSLDQDMTIVSANMEAAELHERRTKLQRQRQDGWNSFAEQELKDYKEGDSAMELFRTIYGDADEDTRRAMIKSYSESGGQVLSTNWDEVKQKKVTYEERK